MICHCKSTLADSENVIIYLYDMQLSKIYRGLMLRLIFQGAIVLHTFQYLVVGWEMLFLTKD